MSSRSFLLPLLAVLASSASLMAAEDAKPTPVTTKGNNLKGHSPFAFAHTLVGAQPLKLVADSRTRFRETKYGKSSGTKRLSAEGYSIDVIGKKISVPYLDNYTMTVHTGNQYAFALMGDVSTTTPPLPLIVEMPNVIIPKTDTHLVFANASPDSISLNVLVDGLLQREAIASGESTATLVLPAGKHQIEIYEGVDRRMTKKLKLRGARTEVLFVAGTMETGDRNPVRLVNCSFKARRR